jgi:hypothetical protein
MRRWREHGAQSVCLAPSPKLDFRLNDVLGSSARRASRTFGAYEEKGKFLQVWPSYGYNFRMSGQEPPEQSTPKDSVGYPGSVVELPEGSDSGHPPNNLPQQLSSFVGRDRGVAKSEAMLAEHRLVTLTGPGGSGKTRLALAVASGVVDDFRDGTWVVELAPLSDPHFVPQEVTSELGCARHPARPLWTRCAPTSGPERSSSY